MTDEGIRGDGIVFCYTELALKSIYEMALRIAPLLEGEILHPQRNANALFNRFKLLGTQGVVGMVLAGIDMTLWDADAKAKNQSLHALIGGTVKPVKPYGNVGYDGIEGSANGAGKCAEEGFLGVKAKIGYPTLDEDLAVIRAMREAVGPDVDLMVDYNQNLTVDEARLRLTRLKDEELTWIEEPVHSHDFENYVRLQNETGAPLQAGENWWGPLDFKIAINAGVKAMIMPDAQKCAGITGWLSISKMAESVDLEVSSHLWPEVSAQLLSVTPTGGWLEYADWFNPIIKEPLKVVNGYADISDVIGTGVDLDDAAVAKICCIKYLNIPLPREFRDFSGNGGFCQSCELLSDFRGLG